MITKVISGIGICSITCLAVFVFFYKDELAKYFSKEALPAEETVVQTEESAEIFFEEKPEERTLSVEERMKILEDMASSSGGYDIPVSVRKKILMEVSEDTATSQTDAWNESEKMQILNKM